MPALNLNSNLNEQQRTSITNLLGSGRTMNQTDAQNLAYATGQSANWQQFLNQSASNYSIGNLSQFVSPATTNTNPTNGNGFTIPGLGGTSMENTGFTTAGLNMTQNEQAIIAMRQQQLEASNAERQRTQAQYDEQYAGLNSAYDSQVSRAEIDKQFKIDEQVQALTKINDQLAQLTGSYLAAKDAIGQQPINTAIIRGQQAIKGQEYANKATVLGMQADALKGNLDLAVQRANSYFDDATAKRKDLIEKHKTLLGLADQKLINLSADDKSNIQSMIDTLTGAETRQTENKDKISALLLDPVAAAAWTKTPGLSLDMEYSEIITKLLPQISAFNMAQSSSGGGTSTTNIASDTKFQTAINRGISSLKQGETWGVVWNRIKQQFPGASSADIDTALGGSYKVPENGASGPSMVTGWASPGAYQQYKLNQSSFNNSTATNIDNATASSLVSDISQGATLQQLYDAYPDVSPSLIIQYYNNQ